MGIGNPAGLGAQGKWGPLPLGQPTLPAPNCLNQGKGGNLAKWKIGAGPLSLGKKGKN